MKNPLQSPTKTPASFFISSTALKAVAASQQIFRKKVVDTKTCFYYLSKSRRKTGVDSEVPITKLTEVLDDKIRVFQVRMQCEYKHREQIFWHQSIEPS